jgi:transposase InsO family protein
VECKGLKFKTIFRFKGKYPINEMCRFFGVSRSGHYDWAKRVNKPDKDESMADLIRKCQNKVNKTYGYRRMRLWLLRETGLAINHKTILRFMNKYELLSEIRRRRKYINYGQQLHNYNNILNREFEIGMLNCKWVTDISYIHTKQGVLYLSVIKDLYDGFIVAYKIGTEQTINLIQIL